MRWWRIIIAAFTVTFFQLTFGTLTACGIFQWADLIQPMDLWKPISVLTGNFLIWLNIGNILFAFFMAASYGLVCDRFPEVSRVVKGAMFGMLIWLMGPLPGMFALYMFTKIAPVVILYWTVTGMMSMQLIGLIIAGIYGGPSKKVERPGIRELCDAMN